MPAGLLQTNNQSKEPLSGLCCPACCVCLLLGRQNRMLYQSELQVAHHTSHTRGLLTNDGVAVFVEASTVTASAFLIKLVAYMLLHVAVGLPPALSIRAGTVTQLIAGSFCAFSWSTGQFTVHPTAPSILHIGSCLLFPLTQHDSNASPMHLSGVNMRCMCSSMCLQTCFEPLVLTILSLTASNTKVAEQYARAKQHA